MDKRLAAGNIDFNEIVFSVLNPKADKVDWLTFETRIRQIITEMVEPIKDRAIDCESKVSYFNAEMENIKVKLTDYEFTH